MLPGNGDRKLFEATMRMIGILAGMVLILALSVPALAADNGALCPNPQQLQCFKTCADVAKAEAEGEVVI